MRVLPLEAGTTGAAVAGLPLARLRRFKLSGRAGPRWCAGPCSSPPHTARNCPRRRAWVAANRRRGRPPIVVLERNRVQLRARGPMQEVALARHGMVPSPCLYSMSTTICRTFRSMLRPPYSRGGLLGSPNLCPDRLMVSQFASMCKVGRHFVLRKSFSNVCLWV